MKKSSADGARMVTLIPGDGIGPEVIAAAVAVVEETGVKPHWDTQVAGMTAFKQVGNPVPDALHPLAAPERGGAQGSARNPGRRGLPLD